VTVSTGQVHSRTGAYALGLRQAEARMFLSNGQVLWLYEPEEKQAFKQDLKTSQLPQPWPSSWARAGSPMSSK